MITENYFTENEDIQLHCNQLIDWYETINDREQGFSDAEEYEKTGNENLAHAPKDVSEAGDFYRSVLETVGQFWGQEVAPRSAEMDRIGLKYENGKVIFPEIQTELFEKIRATGLQPIALGRHYGGLAMPMLMQSILGEIASRADVALSMAATSVNIAEVVERYGSEEFRKLWLPKLASGQLSCAMALTEPNYGSNLPDIQTRAYQDTDRNWRISGTKRFITHACGYINAPSVILTLARTGSVKSGARGLSFFLVEGKDVQIARIEEKLGLHCSPTCEVIYEDAPGHLIGEVGKGLVKYSMGMMNTARLAVAIQAVGIASAAYHEAIKYASERVQFGRPIEEIPAVRKMLDLMEREMIASRMLVYESSRIVDRYLWRKERLKQGGMKESEAQRDAEIHYWEKLADLFTPVSKYYASEWAVQIADRAVQVHGGAGYTEEYDVARIFRDARITTIYEGTTQLQIVAAIAAIVSSSGANGVLTQYIDQTLSSFQPSGSLLKIKELFEQTVELYKSIEGRDAKAAVAFETVETTARLIINMLFEKGIAKLEGKERAKREAQAESYYIDSLGIIHANLLQLEAALEKSKHLKQSVA